MHLYGLKAAMLCTELEVIKISNFLFLSITFQFSSICFVCTHYRTVGKFRGCSEYGKKGQNAKF